MVSKTKYKSFVEALMSIAPHQVDIWGNNVPGLLGGSAATSGGYAPSAMVNDNLRTALGQFSKVLLSNESTSKEIKAKANELEAAIMAEQTINNLTANQAERLISELYDLIEEKGD